jgi:tetratricopeptide (TPR) repeat protein
MHYRRSQLLGLLFAAVLLPAAACAQQDGGSAEAALREGRYDDAIRIGTAAVRNDPADRVAARALAQALLDVGRYDDAAAAAENLPLIRGHALRARGRLPEAEAAFSEAAAVEGSDRLEAEFNLAELLYLRGDREAAMSRFDRFIDIYNNSERLPAQDLTAVGNAVWYLGARESALFQDAVMAFDEATREDPTYIEPHIRLGELFVEKYNGAEAGQALSDALALNPNHPRALLAMARARSFDGERGRSMELVDQSLDVNPNLVPARLFLARMLMDTEDFEAAEAELEKALEVDPSSLEALSTIAALHYIRDDQARYEEVRARVRQLNPTYAGLLRTVAEIAAQVRRYSDAAELAQGAVELDPESWPAYAVLGLNQFRLGQIDEAKQTLERSFEGDPYNVWIKNNLDLLDTFEEYEIRSVEGLEFMLHRDEADLLFPYLAAAATEAHAELTLRYGDQPRGRVRVELYPRSADFSVRTVGLAGLGALGVSFGDLVALDSPAARESGSYNWLMTLWHEMAHTAALGVSGNRVPRWLTEGMSVLEERRTQPAWRQQVPPEFLIAYDEGELPPVSRLNEGFIRPETPQHLGLAYQMASLVAEWVEETRGFEGLVQMLHGYRDGRSNDDILRSVLRAEPEEVDEQFDAWLRARADPDRAREFMTFFQNGQQLLQAGNLPQAKQALESAAAIFPVAGSGSPNALLAQIHLREGNDEAAMAALTVLSDYDENAYGANLELARLREAAGDLAGAAAALERAVWIFPYEFDPHLKLAELSATLDNDEIAVRERRAVVALRPTDMADARYKLAAALFKAGDTEGARTEVLRALEIAPGFTEAQQLLLQLHDAT